MSYICIPPCTASSYASNHHACQWSPECL
uniref:Uncharacterized protein n=1 Tax=Arundo donax TaxID=35708 RepID=A0A0A9H6Q6_ARUDO